MRRTHFEIDHSEKGKITVWGYTFGSIGIDKRTYALWTLTHLKTGLGLISVGGVFDSYRKAKDCAIELNRELNFDTNDIEAAQTLRETVKKICHSHGPVLEAIQYAGPWPLSPNEEGEK